MPFARPTLAELIARIRSDLRGRLEIDGPILRRAMVDVLALVWAGAVHTLYGFLEWLAKQLFARTAEREALLRAAAPYGITLTPATFASGEVVATGIPGTLIPVDTILRLDASSSYRVTTGQVIDGSGQVNVPVTAVLAGDAANVPAGTSLTFENSILGVLPVATVGVDGIEDGNDEEDIEQLRARYILRLGEPPTGGSDQDYEAWALAVAGVTRVWVYRHENGLGTVVVRFVRDNDVSIFPDAGAVAAVQAKFASERPTTAEVLAAAPMDLPVAFTIQLTPDNGDTRAAVTAELRDLFRRAAQPGDGIGRGKVKLSEIRTAIGTSAGVTDYVMTIPAADVVPGVGELATVGVITWV